MAQMLEVSCGSCGAQEIQLDGPTFSGNWPRCEQCGETRLVPPGGRNGNPDSSRLSDDTLTTWITREAGICSCGGRFSFEARLRCLVCRSIDVSSTSVGIIAD